MVPRRRINDTRDQCPAVAGAIDVTTNASGEGSMMTQRNHTRGIGLLVAVFGFLCVVGPARGLTLVERGRPVSTIVIPENGEWWTVRSAAEYIQEYVKKATGAELAIVSEDDAPDGALISVGHTKLAAAAGIGAEGLALDSCRLVVRDKVLFLIGRDGVGGKATTPRGTCRAAVTFLEKYLGVRWFIPTLHANPEGELVPATGDLTVPDDLRETITSHFAYVISGPYFNKGHPSHIANNSCSKIKAWTVGGHSWGVWVPLDKYFKDHPEYFALLDGKRSDNKHNYLCMSNPEVRNIMVRETRKLFDEGYDWVQLGPSDGMSYATAACKCSECEKLDTYSEMGKSNYPLKRLKKHPPERIHLAHKWIVDECRKSHPDKTIHLLLYQPTRMPSRLFDSFGDTVVGENAVAGFHNFKEVSEAWQGKVRAFTSYLYWEATTIQPLGILPTITPDSVAEELRYYHENDVIGMYFCHNRLGQNWGLWGPVYYVVGRMMGDPNLDPDDLVNEYCDGVYAETAETMKAFFDYLYARVGSTKPDGEDTMGDRLLTVYPPRVVQSLEDMLSKAETDAVSARAKGWLRLTRDYFDYVKTLSHVFAAEKTYLADPNEPNLLAVRDRVDEFETYRERIVSYADNQDYWYKWHPMYIYLNQYLRSDWTGLHTENLRGKPTASRRITAPITWDFEGKLEEVRHDH